MKTLSIMRPIRATLVLLSLATMACSRDTSPTTPTLAPPPLTGTWTGDLTLQGIPARMTWTLTQNGTAVTGPVLVLLPTGTVLLNGVLSGTLSGTTLPYTITVSPGGIPSQPGCTGQLTGSVTTTISTVSSLAGSYAVTTATCPTAFSSGNFTLTKTS